MTKTIPMDRAGRIVLPKPIRDKLRLHAGDRLELESSGDCITLRFPPASTPLCKEQGVWVYRSGKKTNESIPDLVDGVRNERLGTAES
ncbi:MAG: AbrB/MazE/SpoVT family DNA-binding domain-containing protein [Elusimicrobia bacterium]|nr:AbrB/MazE/SpoVT family DNA-binding domain-containing protein [Elusimicrobiota bacterium]